MFNSSLTNLIHRRTADITMSHIDVWVTEGVRCSKDHILSHDNATDSDINKNTSGLQI